MEVSRAFVLYLDEVEPYNAKREETSLVYGDVTGESRRLHDGVVEVKISTPNEDINKIIGDGWHTSAANRLPYVNICVKTQVGDTDVELSISGNSYLVSSPSVIGVIPYYVPANEIIEAIVEMRNVNTSIGEYPFYYGGVELYLTYEHRNELIYNVALTHSPEPFAYNRRILSLGAPLVCSKDKMKVVASSFTDVIGEHISSGENYMLTYQECKTFSKEIYLLITQRLASMTKSSRK